MSARVALRRARRRAAIQAGVSAVMLLIFSLSLLIVVVRGATHQ